MLAAAFRSRPLQVLLLLACSFTAANAGEPQPAPATVIGIGGVVCTAYLDWFRTPDTEQPARDVFTWVEGYFSARNLAHNGRVATVGGSLSEETLQSMFKDQCREMIAADVTEKRARTMVFMAADALYRELEVKGL